ncbi:hypothetical protein OGAPHI_001367 [Ogataea philodendri]|uniref:Oligomycin resistance ATP-dependent permease YOR1 n=1 Tax=Ogataea philodendri TaxID=1378263 RepID=A0A9P8T8Q9_9ASCO|nr:uncharacterized protein OGAPHI_001367 [Ogataea philodendri]KAH3669246.1 hypothetical protein OGAPHI_001367 [Ogataea philodendri]
MKVGYKRTLQPEDMYTLDEDESIENMYSRFNGFLEMELAAAKANHVAKKCADRGETPDSSSFDQEADLEDFEVHYYSIARSLFHVFGWQYMWAALLNITSDLTIALVPLLQKKLVNFVEKKAYGFSPDIGKGVGYAIGCSLMTYFAGFTINHYVYNGVMVGSKVKAVLTKLLLEKSFKLDARGRHEFPVGRINSIMGTDLTRVDLAIGFFPIIFEFPISLAVAIVLLIINIGVSSLAGLAVFFASIAFTTFMIRLLYKMRKSVNVFTDKRVDLVKELLKNFKMVKMYGWENSYFKQFVDIRKKEMRIIMQMQFARNILDAISIWLPTVTSMAAFVVLHHVDPTRSVGDIFSSLTLFQVIIGQFSMIPTTLSMSADMIIGFKRIAKLISCPDAQDLESFHEPLSDEKLALRLNHATFNWYTFEDIDAGEYVSDNKSEKSVLSSTTFPGLLDLNFSVAKGEFVVVTGSVGSGKSSLLSAMSGFMPLKDGSVAKNGSLILCGYPWMQNATVRENITFGEPFDREKYDTVVKVCSLRDDFAQLPASDMTEVGERGITLSGGQKARINLARAVYSDRDIILLDDVLSAVDAKVGKHIMEQCILGYLKNKTRILATHQLSLINAADKVIFLNGNGTIDYGTLNEVKGRNSAFVKLMTFSHGVGKDDKQDETNDEKKKDEFEDDEEDGKLMREEERAINGISWDVYNSYLLTGSGSLGYLYPALIIIVVTLCTFAMLFTNNWLSFWEDKRFHKPSNFYQGVYVMLCFVSLGLLTLLFLLMARFCNTAATEFNISSFKRLLHAPMSFLDTTPMGRVLNRFTKDAEVLDNEIQEQLRMLLYQLGQIVGTFVLCVIYLPWSALVFPVVFVAFYVLCHFYLASSREINRLEALKRSQVYSHFNEALAGMDTIKAHSSSKRFLKVNGKLIDNMNESTFTFQAIQRWVASNLELMVCGLSFVICLLCTFGVFNIKGAYAGLILTYVFNIVGILSFLLRSATEVENQMNSVERLKFYAFDLQQEAAFDVPENDPESEWPAFGAISFNSASMKYREGLPYAVKGLDLKVGAGEKIGVCGRTGAGKSSVMYCLFRLAEYDGQITIDGVDISKIGLHKLRTKLSIIPQDPVLFSGTVRSNLDPFQEHSDDKLWTVLTKAGLIDASIIDQVKVQKKSDRNLHKFHLERLVEDDGSNFSLGERQLLALARALVKGSRILVLDEATSSVDYETDAKVQKTISREFADCTVLCIAHRLKTIVNYDRIMVLDKGEIVELDRPRNLYEQGGIFRSMCDKSGVVEADFN